MMNQFLSSLSLLVLLLFQCTTTTTTVAQSPAQAPAPPAPTNITNILQKAGQYTMFIRLLRTTQQGDQIDTQLSNSNQGLTIFAPTDQAFSNLKSGTLNSLSDQQKVQLVLFHVIPFTLSRSQFLTVTNPLRTQAGGSGAGEFPLNVTASSAGQVSVSTGLVDATVDNTVYADSKLVVYQLEKVLLPMSIFPPSSPASPKAKEKSPDSGVQSSGGAAAAVASGAVDVTVGSVGVFAVIAAFSLGL